MTLTKEEPNILQYILRPDPETELDLHHRCIWARIYLDLDHGILTACTDAANAAHRWPENGMDFLHLMATADKHYLMAKLFERNFFGLDEAQSCTIENIRERNNDPDVLEEYHLTDEQLECLTDEIDFISCRTADQFYRDAEEILDGFYPCGPYDDLIDTAEDYSPQEYTFMELFTQYLQPELRRELEERNRLDGLEDGWFLTSRKLPKPGQLVRIICEDGSQRMAQIHELKQGGFAWRCGFIRPLNYADRWTPIGG